MSSQGGSAGPMAVFKGYRSHYGAGLGNVLSGLLRAAVPIVAPAVKNIGQSLLSAGTNKLQNIIQSTLGGPGAPTQPYVPVPPPAPRRRAVKRKVASRRKPVKRRRRNKADIFSA